MNTLPFDDLETEVLSGLRHEASRMDEARSVSAFYRGDFAPYLTPSDTTRTSLILRKVIDTLAVLYRASPIRTLPSHPEATSFLQQCFKDNAAFALWQAADRQSMLNEVAAFQVAGTEDPSHPIKLWLWSAEQFSVFVDPDDPCRPLAVCTIDAYDNQRRYTLWTDETRSVYLTDKTGPLQTSGGTAPRRVVLEPNPYNVLPFSFVHHTFPTNGFWSGSPGSQLKEVNAYVNTRLSESADAIRYLGRPIGVIEGAGPDWRPPVDPKPGDFITLPFALQDASGQTIQPSLKYLEADLGFVSAEWEDLSAYLNHTLECHGVPESAIRMVQSAGRSGVSIQSEQIPILGWVQSRKLPFSHYEEDLARLVLTVAQAHFANNNVPAAFLAEALEDYNLSIRWPDLWTELPGEERDRSDEWSLLNGLTSKVQLMQKRYGLTREEAIQSLERIAEDTEQEKRIYGEVIPVTRRSQITGAEATATPEGNEV